MNNISYKIYSFFLLLCLIVGAGCEEDEQEIPTGIFIAPNSRDIVEPRNVVFVENYESSIAFSVAVYEPASEEIQVAIRQNNELVSQYNSTNGTQYEPLPEQSIRFSSETPVIEKGEKNSAEIEALINSDLLDEDKTYMLALEITNASGNIVLNKAMNVKYFSLKGGPPPNIALGKPTNQSSITAGGLSPRAVDGNTNGAWSAGSVTHTAGVGQDWWEVDLEAISPLIAQINIYNRTDCCAQRLVDFHVFVSDVPFESTSLEETQAQEGVSDYFTAGVGGAKTEIKIGRTGRYVRVQLEGNTPLALAEVEILAL
ncbi:DUF1735 domain-containing protein [Echinicola marina]|uniref:BT_3987 domain-containing protein n=1 Tax=Echinicola marina TaxID=2859768 RepID=UPI001CF6C8A5|nr:DUF1735 domain-containing protein [Echinicola marina]UCS91876.1 DUF1735 domain-containing protein [Echinicola marina]